jgi:hypothetical protein
MVRKASAIVAKDISAQPSAYAEFETYEWSITCE